MAYARQNIPVSQILFDILILNRRYTIVQFLYLFGYHIYSRNMMMLSKQCSNTQAHVAGSCHSHVYIFKFTHTY